MLSNHELAQAIAEAWEPISSILGTHLANFERQLIVMLRQLESPDATEQTSAVNAIVALFSKAAAADQLLRQALEKVTAREGRSKGVGLPAGYHKMDRYTVVPVLFGTNRALATGNGSLNFEGSRGDPSFGVARVSIPDDHRMGKIEKPSIWRLEFRENPSRHIVVLDMQKLSDNDFLTNGRELLASGKNEILLFIHGYNVGFADALRRTAQLAYDLHFEGLAMLYSWPSEGSFARYSVDETNVDWSRPQFVNFLQTVRQKTGVDKLHIVAHSMGNRLLSEALAEDSKLVTGNWAPISQVAFAAPDIDTGRFKDLLSAFKGRAGRFTLYSSSRDVAILASKAVHRYPRAGEAGPDLFVAEGLDTVDATAADTSLLGHSYYGDNRSVVSDLFYVVRHGLAPSERSCLRQAARFGRQYWVFDR